VRNVQFSNELLKISNSFRQQGQQYLLTLDKLWFDLSTDHEIIGLREGKVLPDIEKQKIGEK
jgi:hypothetical protein